MHTSVKFKGRTQKSKLFKKAGVPPVGSRSSKINHPILNVPGVWFHGDEIGTLQRKKNSCTVLHFESKIIVFRIYQHKSTISLSKKMKKKRT